MNFIGVEEYNAYLGIKDGLKGSYTAFIELSNNEPIMHLESFKQGFEAYLMGYLLGLEITKKGVKK